MIIKFGSAKIAGVATNPVSLRRLVGYNAFIKIAAIYELDTDKYLYIRNHSVSSGEYWGPNGNGDYFPEKELAENYKTFIGQRVSIDHKDDLIIGHVLTSKYVPWDNTKKIGAFVENILAIDKELAEKIHPGLIQLIIEGKITDTSMGALTRYTICSICGNVAETEEEYCDHVKNHKMEKIALANGEKRLVYEICHEVSFFEDSIIVPLHLGGKAGGEGADPKAKVIQIIASVSKIDLSRLIDSIDNSISSELSKNFFEELNSALEQGIEPALAVIYKYSTKVEPQTKRLFAKLASLLKL
uniref:Uncharacterized protein n=1 Tax=Fervidicoccus fontis TaxID=683846 RepID=A0A7J3SL14_9CREN